MDLRSHRQIRCCQAERQETERQGGKARRGAMVEGIYRKGE